MKSIGRYQIEEPIGFGGMARIYLAQDNELDRKVAIKVIHAGHEDDPEFLQRFRMEAKALIALTHPNIVRVYEYGIEGEMPYLVMDYLPSGNIKKLMGKPMPYQEAARLLLPVARALQCAHEKGILHRDIKPTNILLTKDNLPVLSDFGIVKFLDSRERTKHTITSSAVGTPEYMAPEQWWGKADERSDVYSLGVVFYELVTGVCPFSAETPAQIYLRHSEQKLSNPQELVAELPENVTAIIMKALEKIPDQRYQDMKSFADALQELVAPTVRDQMAIINTRRNYEALQARRQMKRRRMIRNAVFFLLLIGALAGTAGHFYSTGQLNQRVMNTSIAFVISSTPTKTSTLTVTVTPTATPTSTFTLTPTQTNTPSTSPTITQTPTPTPDVISIARINDLIQVGRWQGGISEITFNSKNLVQAKCGYKYISVVLGNKVYNSPETCTWDTQNGTLVKGSPNYDANLVQRFYAKSEYVSSEVKKLKARSEGNNIIVQYADNTLYCSIRDESSYVAALAFSPDGELLVSGGYDGIVHFWRIQDCKSIREMSLDGVMNSFAFYNDGSLLAMAGSGLVYVWAMP